MIEVQTAGAIRMRSCRQLSEVEPELWDRILPPGQPWHSHRFLRVVENSGVESAEYWYCLFYVGDRLVATAVLSAFRVDMGLFLDGVALQALTAIRRLWPRLMKPRLLMCGIPVSLGQSNLLIAEEEHRGPVLMLLAKEMERLAAGLKIKQLCLKEFKEAEVDTLAPLLEVGYFKALSIPYMQMAVHWSSFEDYLADLRHPYRRKIRRSLRKIGLDRPVYKPFTTEAVNGPEPLLVYGGPEVCPAEDFHRLYRHVIDRAETKLEFLTVAFFEQLFDQMGDNLQILALYHQGKVLAAAILLEEDQRLSFVLLGRESDKDDPFDGYFNLVYAILTLAIDKGCKQILLGQTAYHVKQRIGGLPIPEYLYFRSRNPLVHALLKAGKSAIFPQTPLQSLRVFHQK